MAGKGWPVAGLVPLKSPWRSARGGQQGGVGQALANPEAFVLAKKNVRSRRIGPPKACAKLILAIGRNRQSWDHQRSSWRRARCCGRIRRRCREAIGSRPAHNVDLRARHHALVGGVGVLNHAEFPDGIGRGVHRQAVGERLDQSDAVQREVVALGALPVHGKTQSQRGGIELLRGAVGIGRDRAGRQQGELRELAAIQGQGSDALV